MPRRFFKTLTLPQAFILGVAGVGINKPFDENGDFRSFTQKDLRISSFH